MTTNNLNENISVFQVSGDVDPFLIVNLNDKEKIFCESDAMVYMDGALDLTGKMNGGFFQAFFRKLANGESFFQQEIVANRGNGMALLAPNSPGGIQILKIDNQNQFYVSDGAYLAATSGVSLNAKTQSITGALFGGNGGFFIGETSGNGYLAITGFGSLQVLDIDTTQDNQDCVIDNGHIVAWDKNLRYKISTSTNKSKGLLGSIVNSIISSEGLVMRFSGKGKAIVCSRNRGNYIAQLAAQLGLNNNNNN